MQYPEYSISKDEAIDWLVNDDIDTIKQAIFNDDYSYLSDILKHGKSYFSWSMDDLLSEIREREN